MNLLKYGSEEIDSINKKENFAFVNESLSDLSDNGEEEKRKKI